MHPQHFQTKSPFTCAIKLSTLKYIYICTHTLYVYRLELMLWLLLLFSFRFLTLKYGKTVYLNAARKTATLQVKVNEHNSGHFNNRKFIIKYVKLCKNRLRPPQQCQPIYTYMYNKILNKNSSCIVFFSLRLV